MTRRDLIAGALAALLLATAAGAGSGRYRLVEQRYEQGGANRLDNAPHEVTLEVTDDGKVWLESDAERDRRYAWPAWVGERGPLSLVDVETVVDPVTGSLRASYSVRPDDTRSFVLHVEERYAPGPGGRSLEGTMTVRFERDGRSGGGFTLTRRFERE